MPWDQRWGEPLTASAASGIKVARVRFWLERGTWEPVASMSREKSKWKPHEDQSTDAGHRGGLARSSEEVPVMGIERRGQIIQFRRGVNPAMGMNLAGRRGRRPDDKSRMSREAPVRFCEGLGVKFPRATRPISRQRFLLEAEVTGGLEHPGIVPVYGLGTYSDGRPYYAMRFIKGDSLKEAIDQFHKNEALKADPGRRSLDLRKLLRRFTDVCNAIDYAHSRGVLHRDIKPGNIIVGKHGETLVVDWGLAKPLGRAEPGGDPGERTLVPSSASGSSSTLPGSTLGTPAYMSPEQARGDLDRLGPRSDVYALGATLHCLLTGRPPFDGDDIGEVIRKVQQGEFASPRKLDPSIDPALEAVCKKAMATRPDDRYATSRDLADDIERWMADEPVTAWREPLSRRARRWARQNRTAVTALASSVLVALVGTAAVLGVQTRANGQLQQANTKLAIANASVKQRFNLAMDAIKLFHGEVSDDLLMKEKQFDGLRTKLLKGAAGFYSRLEALLKDQPDRESRAALGNAYDELGTLTEKIGDQAAALAVHRQALAVRRSLASGSRANAATTLDVARSLNAAGWLQQSTGDKAGALASFDEASRLAEEAERQGGAAEQAQDVMARAFHRKAYVQFETGDPAAAAATCGQALAIRQKLADAYPGVTDYQRDLAMSHNNIGWMLATTADSAKQRAAHGQALAIQQKLADSNPSITQFQLDLALSHSNIGWSLFATGDISRGASGLGQGTGDPRKAGRRVPERHQISTGSGGELRDRRRRIG